MTLKVTYMTKDQLSFNTRKSLCNHLGEIAGTELADYLQQLKMRLEQVEMNKVDVTKIVPDSLAAAPLDQQCGKSC